MIIVALVATMASTMIWLQWRAVQVEMAERGRLQSSWILSGALDWAKLILLEDAKSGRPTALSEPWAVPLAEARLSTFLAADTAPAEGEPEAFLSGHIEDAQGRFNLRNLVDAAGRDVSAADVAAFRRLLENANLSPLLADQISNGLKNALVPEVQGDAPPPLMPQSIAQLRWLGVQDTTIDQLSRYVVLLPVPTTLNANTAQKEVLAAVLSVDLGTAQRLVQSRRGAPFRSVADLQDLLPPTVTIDPQKVGTISNFFEVHGQLRMGDRVLMETSLVERRGFEMITLSRRKQPSYGQP